MRIRDSLVSPYLRQAAGEADDLIIVVARAQEPGWTCRSMPSVWTEASSSGLRRRTARYRSLRRRWPICFINHVDAPPCQADRFLEKTSPRFWRRSLMKSELVTPSHLARKATGRCRNKPGARRRRADHWDLNRSRDRQFGQQRRIVSLLVGDGVPMVPSPTM